MIRRSCLGSFKQLWGLPLRQWPSMRPLGCFDIGAEMDDDTLSLDMAEG